MTMRRGLAFTLALVFVLGLLGPPALVPKISAEEGELDYDKMPLIVQSEGVPADSGYRWEKASGEGEDPGEKPDETPDVYTLTIFTQDPVVVMENPAFADPGAVAKIVIENGGDVTVEQVNFRNGGDTKHYQYENEYPEQVYIFTTGDVTLVLNNTHFTPRPDASARAVKMENGEVALTLNSVTSSVPIMCGDRSEVVMTVVGENTVSVDPKSAYTPAGYNNQAAYYSAIYIDPTADLTIDGDGTLNLSAEGAPALGGGSVTSGCSSGHIDMGSLTIKNTVVNATTERVIVEEERHGYSEPDMVHASGIAIGTGAILGRYVKLAGTAEKIHISGGTVLASSTDLANIGFDDSTYGLIIDGGSVKAADVATAADFAARDEASYEDQDYYGFKDKLTHRPTNSNGDLLFLTTVENLAVSSRVTALTLEDGYDYGIENMFTDSDGKIYLWLPSSLAGTDGVVKVGGQDTTFTIPGDNKFPKPQLDVHFTFNNQESMYLPLEEDRIITLAEEAEYGIGYYRFSYYADSAYKTLLYAAPTTAGDCYVKVTFEPGIEFTGARNIPLGKLTLIQRTPTLDTDFTYQATQTLPLDEGKLTTAQWPYGHYLSQPSFTYFSDDAYSTQLDETPTEGGACYVKVTYPESDVFEEATIPLGKLTLLSSQDDVTITLDDADSKYLYILDMGYIVSDAPVGYASLDHAKAVAFAGNYILKSSGEAAAFVSVEGSYKGGEMGRTITLDGLNLNVGSGENNGAFTLMNNAKASLLLKGANVLRSGANKAGLAVKSGAALIIDVPAGQLDSYGSLLAASDGNGAGIGGNWNENGIGRITIHGGTITAYCSENNKGYGAGIGLARQTWSIEDMTITGGIVNACSSLNGVGLGAGIGGARTNDYGEPARNITISGGTITACSSLNGTGYGAGIGGAVDKAESELGQHEPVVRYDLIITGGSIISKKDLAGAWSINNPINGGKTRAHLATLTLFDVNEITPVTFTDILGYGIKSVQTDAEGKLYFWIPTVTSSDITVSTDGGAYSGSVTVETGFDSAQTLTQSKAQATVSVTPPQPITYGEALGDPDAEVTGVTIANPVFTYSYSGRNNTTYTDHAKKPTQPGDYVVRAILKDAQFYGAGTAEFSIGKKQLSWTEGTVESKEYDGSTRVYSIETTPDFDGIINYDSVYVDHGNAVFASADAGTEIEIIATGWSIDIGWGQYQLYLAPEEEPGFAKASITKAAPREDDHYSVELEHELPFDEESILVFHPWLEGYGEVSYSYYTDKSYTQSVSKPATAGKYYVAASISGGNNFLAESDIRLGTLTLSGESGGEVPIEPIPVDPLPDEDIPGDTPGDSNAVEVPSVGGATNGDGETVQVEAEIDTQTGEVSLALDEKTITLLIDHALEKTAAAEERGEEASSIVTLTLEEVAGAASVSIPQTALEPLAENGVSLCVQLPAGELIISPETLKELSADLSGDERLRVEIHEASEEDLTAEQVEELKEASGEHEIYHIDVYLGSRKVNIPATVSLTYALKPTDTAEGLGVWFVNSLGFLQNMKGVYNRDVGKITFTVNHQSIYIVGMAQALPFTDVTHEAWYFDAVGFVYENRLMTGVSDDLFAPSMSVNRGMLVTILWNMERHPAATGADRFSDLTQDWYRTAVNWAADNDIVRGYGDGAFGPEDIITREQMVAILQRYCSFKGIEATEQADLAAFADYEAVSPWALENVRWSVASGLLLGRENSVLAPRDQALRSEIATVLQRFAAYLSAAR